MGEGAVADDGHSWPLTSVSSTLSHGNGSTHVDARMDGFVRRQEAQRVAADVAEDARVVELREHLVQSGVDIAVAAALTKCWRTGNNIFTSLE